MLKQLLFETRVGEMLLTLLERKTGLAVVDANWLSHQPAARPTVACSPAQGQQPCPSNR